MTSAQVHDGERASLPEWLADVLADPRADGRLKGEPIPAQISILVHPETGWGAIITYANGEGRVAQGPTIPTKENHQ